MKHTKFDSEESERAKRLNDSIGTVTMLNNDCIMSMKAYFSDAEGFFGYLRFKVQYSRGIPQHNVYRGFLGDMKGFHGAMLNVNRMLTGLESSFTEYSRSMGWLSRHLATAETHAQKAELFGTMEDRTERMLSSILTVKREIDYYTETFSMFYREVMIREMN